MSKKDSDLVKKIGWAYNVKEILPSDMPAIVHCRELEDEGFGMLADKFRLGRIDDSDSVVCPDGTIIGLKDIEKYNEKRNGSYNSENTGDVKIHKADMYYLGFKLKLL